MRAKVSSSPRWNWQRDENTHRLAHEQRRGLCAVADYRGRLFSDRVGFRRGAWLRGRDWKTSLAGTHGRTSRVAFVRNRTGLFFERRWRDAHRETGGGISIGRAKRTRRKMFSVTRRQRWKYFYSWREKFILHWKMSRNKHETG